MPDAQANAQADAGPGKKPLICLAASGGGHLRQVLDLEKLWSQHPHFLVTEDSVLGRSVAERVETEFVPHFALGQARLGSPFTMLGRAFKSIWQSLSIIRRRRPDVIITTGAGSQLFILIWARLFGARIILIDSFARFERPSAFARLAGPLAHLRISQSARSARHWPGAITYDPLRKLTPAPSTKEALVFATVGATLPFDRLVKLVVEAKQNSVITQDVVLQVGKNRGALTAPEGLTIAEELPFEEVQALLGRAEMVICHGGTGSIITALQNHCKVIVIPRRFSLGEHYDEHQSEIAESFADRGLVQCAHDASSLQLAIANSRAQDPVGMTTDYTALMERLAQYIRGD